MASFLKTLFLNPPSFEGFDGGAGSRYQARREIKSFWYPTWLAQPAAMVPGSKLIDAPPDELTVEQVAPLAKDYELAVLHTSTPSFANDAKFAARLKEENPKIMIGMVGAHVGVLPLQSMNAAPAVDWVAVGEFDYACKEVASGKPLREVQGIAYRENGHVASRLRSPRSRIWTRCPSWWTSISATLLSRIISSAICSIPTYRSTPAAAAARSVPSACGRKRSAGTATACAAPTAWKPRWRSRRNTFRKCANFSLTMTLSPTTCRALKKSPAAWASWGCAGPATPRPTCRARRSKS